MPATLEVNHHLALIIYGTIAMGQDISTAKKAVVVVNFRDRSAVIKRHDVSYEKAIEAVKAVKTFQPELLDQDIYFTAKIEKLGPNEVEVTPGVWSSVMPFVEELNVRIVGEDSGQQPATHDLLTPSPPYDPAPLGTHAKDIAADSVKARWAAGPGN